MYKPRFALTNNLLNVYSAVINSNNFCNGALPNKISTEKVLVVSKLSRYEFERNKQKNLSEKELEKELRNRGTDFDKLMYFHNLHKNFETGVLNTLKSMGISVQLVNRFSYNEDKIKWADLIMPVGGDGTFLLAASRVRDSRKPVVGFNSDPNRSEGHLCLPKRYSTDTEEAIKQLQSGTFKWLLRSRIRTTVYGCDGCLVPKHLHSMEGGYELQAPLKSDNLCKDDGFVLPYLALNEVFVGECLSARVSHLEMRLNSSEEVTNMKCSGLCVTTGTGSTSWHLSINRLPGQSVVELLKLLDIHSTEAKESLATVLADIYNKNLIFTPDEKRLNYTIRDLISAGVWPQPKGVKSRGFASKIQIRSKCFDGYLVIDGGISFSFNDGTVAVLEINPEDSLCTVVLPE